ncbi:Calx-beta domain-containing protein [Alteromonas gracilis]|uniref:Calx-beta domain-containing protein n=1 Tax=Alteromonas gracilis TaxID=1479524 RepID=UPI002FE40C8D
MRALFFIAFLFIFFSNCCLAESLLFLPTSAEKEKKILASASHIDSKIKQYYFVSTLNTSALQSLAVGDALAINIVSDITSGQVERIYYGSGGTKHIVVRSYIESIPVFSLVSINENSSYVELSTPDGYITGFGADNYVMLHKPADIKRAELTSAGSSISHAHDFVMPSRRALPVISRSAEELTEGLLSTQSERQDYADIAIIDIFFVYSRNVFDVISDIDSRIDHYIAFTNQVFSDSGIHATVNAVGKLEVDYPYNTSQQGLEDISSGTFPFENVKALRLESGADAVALLTPQAKNDSAGGIAFLNSHLNQPSSDSMYSQTDIDGGASVFTHELGHNLGLGHSRPQNSKGADYDFGVGYRVPTSGNEGFHSIMSYSAEGVFLDLPLFSNPSKLCGSFPCGVSKNDAEFGADAVYVVNNVRHIVAAYGSRSTLYVDIDEALDNIADTNLRACIERALNGDIAFASQVKYVSCDDEVLTLSGLSQFGELTTLYLSDIKATDISPLESLSRLRELSLSGVLANDFAALGELSSLESLNLHSNRFSNSQAGLLANLSQLQRIEIQSNSLTELPELSKLARLNYIYINAPLISLESIAQNRGLQHVYIRKSTSLLPSEFQWPLLKTLALYGSPLASLEPILKLDTLEELTITNSMLTSLEGITELQHLRGLYLPNNFISYIGDLSTLNSLVSLDLTENPIKDINHLRELTQLQSLRAGSYSRYYDWSFIDELSELTSLSLIGVNQDSFSAISTLSETIGSLSLKDLDSKDLSPLFDLLRLQYLYINAADSITFYCWQQQYIGTIGQNSKVIGDCEPSDDSSDFDEDGTSNIVELQQGTNPVENDNEPAIIEFLDSALTFNEIEGGINYSALIRRKGNSQLESNVNLVSIDNSATHLIDYYFIDGMHTFPRGANTTSFTFDIYDDAIVEGEETFIVSMSSVSNGTIGTKESLEITIDDNLDGSDYIVEEPTAQQSIFGWDSTIYSANESDREITLILHRPTDKSGEFAVTLSPIALTRDTEGTFSVDVTELHFDKEDTFKAVTVSFDDDNIYMGDRFVSLRLSNPTNVSIDPAFATANLQIKDDEANGRTIEFTEQSHSVREGEGEVLIELYREGTDIVSREFRIAQVNGSAKFEKDALLQSDTVTMLPHEHSKTISLSIEDDNFYEDSEYLALEIQGLARDLIGANFITYIYIDDNDSEENQSGIVSFSESSSVVSENDGIHDVRISRSGDSSESLSVYVYTENTSANEADYFLSESRVTFEPKEVEKNISLTIVQDGEQESSEKFNIILDAGEKYTGGNSTHTITITDYESTPPSIVSMTEPYLLVSEAAGTIEVSISRTGNISGKQKVEFVVFAKSATSDKDYFVDNETVTFEPGEALKRVPVTLIDDSETEIIEQFDIGLVDSNDITLEQPYATVIDILDNDSRHSQYGEVSFYNKVVKFDEKDEVANIRLIRTGSVLNELEVTVDINHGTTSEDDIFISGEKIIFREGEIEKWLLVNIISDKRKEGVESFSLTLNSEYNDAVSKTPLIVNVFDDGAVYMSPYDYDGDGISDLVIRRPDIGQFLVARSSDNGIMRAYFGANGSDIPLAGDFDGDGITDIAIRRPSAKQFITKGSSDNQIDRLFFGSQDEDIPVLADYDGDGITDIAIRRPSTGQWFIKYSSTGSIARETFGTDASDIPAIADYDGDGKADIAVRRQSAGQFIIKYSSTGSIARVFFGSQMDDIAVPADYDGDGKADIAIRRPSSGYWFIKRSSDDVIERLYFGSQADDIPVVADYDGDGISDIAIRRPSTGSWIVRLSSDNSYARYYFGSASSDIPLAAPLTQVLSMTPMSSSSTGIDISEDEIFGGFEQDTPLQLIKEIIKPEADWVIDEVTLVD